MPESYSKVTESETLIGLRQLCVTLWRFWFSEPGNGSSHWAGGVAFPESQQAGAEPSGEPGLPAQYCWFSHSTPTLLVFCCPGTTCTALLEEGSSSWPLTPGNFPGPIGGVVQPWMVFQERILWAETLWSLPISITSDAWEYSAPIPLPWLSVTYAPKASRRGWIDATYQNINEFMGSFSLPTGIKQGLEA